MIGKERKRRFAGRWLGGEANAVLQVEDDAVGAGRGPFREAIGPIGRREQKAAGQR